MALANPLKSYQQIATKTAPPGQLVLMLYEGIIRFLNRAAAGFQIDDPADCNTTISNNIIKAQDIIFELNVTLNMEQGGQLAQTLRSLYDYMDRRLLEANLKKDETIIREIIGRATVLRDAWAQMLSGTGQQAAAAMPAPAPVFAESAAVAA